MRTSWLSLLGAAGLLAAFAAPAWAQEGSKEKVWTGKRWEWTAKKAVEEPKTVLVEVAPADRKDGDIRGLRTVGKHPEVVYFRRVPRPEAVAVKGHTCSLRAKTVLKHVEFQHFCRVDGAEKPCPGMTKAGECLALVK